MYRKGEIIQLYVQNRGDNTVICTEQGDNSVICVVLVTQYNIKMCASKINLIKYERTTLSHTVYCSIL